jgi:hypothetical protein
MRRNRAERQQHFPRQKAAGWAIFSPPPFSL